MLFLQKIPCNLSEYGYMKSIYLILHHMATPIKDDTIIIDPSLLVEPDESEEHEDEFGFDGDEMTIDGEDVVDDEEFDEDREDIYESYEEDPGLLDEDDDL
jgi:hypothetical protein